MFQAVGRTAAPVGLSPLKNRGGLSTPFPALLLTARSGQKWRFRGVAVEIAHAVADTQVTGVVSRGCNRRTTGGQRIGVSSGPTLFGHLASEHKPNPTTSSPSDDQRLPVVTVRCHWPMSLLWHTQWLCHASATAVTAPW